MKYTESIENLIDCFKLLPGIGEKNAERLAFSMLNFDDEQIAKFIESINNVHTKVKKCKKCNNLTENKDNCNICDDNDRDSSLLCVVENTKNLVMFEKANIFPGKYFVLEGLISPLEGIGPVVKKVNHVINLVKNSKIIEIICALHARSQGATTSLYISKLLEGLNIKITKIAAGVPVGADMEYLDSITIQRAIEGRTTIS